MSCWFSASVLVPVRAHLQGFSDPPVGALGAAYYLGFAVVAAQTFPLHAATAALPVWLLLRLRL